MFNKIQDVYKNYDYVFKEALTIYKDKTLDFLGLHNLGAIGEPLRTENVEIIIKQEFVDLTFALLDGRGVNLEEEVRLSRKALKRFASYNLWLSQEYNRDFVTVIFVKEPTNITELVSEQIRFKPLIVQCSNINADAMLEKLKKDLAEGREVNELEIIYLPLFASKKLSPTQLFTESSKLIKRLNVNDEERMKLYALSIVLAGKVVEKDQLDKLWEEIKLMRNAILEYAEERGIKLGEERGKELNAKETARRLLAKGYDLEEIAEVTDISVEQLLEMR